MSAAQSIFIAGPTASGKSAVAMELAEKLGGEIISVDSMQVYRGLDIGTAKPSLEERARVIHHLIDVVDVTQSFDAWQFVRRARVAESEIHARGRWAIFCGGGGLYLKAYLDGIGDAPPPNIEVRKDLEATPMAELLRELQRRDPATYETIDRQNPRRVVRALEVIRATGKPFSDQRVKWQKKSPDRKYFCGGESQIAPSVSRGASMFGLIRSAGDLHDRIDARVDEMFARGLVEETDALLKCGLGQNRTAMQALGYRQTVEHLRGERSLEQTIALVKLRTRQFAKRQMTWFRRQLEVNWIPVEPTEREVPGRIVREIIARTMVSE